MKKIWFRFIIYFTICLIGFIIYFSILFPLILYLIQPGITIEQTYAVEGDPGLAILAFLICFLSGGFFFSLLFVRPIYQILLSINSLAKGESLDHSRLYNRRNKLKEPYSLFKEIISDLQSLEQALRQAERRRAEVETAKSDWLAGVSHDLKTPLSYISGYSSLLLSPGYSFSQDEMEHHLSRIYQKSVYIKSLIDDMNLLFLIERDGRPPLNPENTELVDFLQGLVSDVAENPRAFSYNFNFFTREDKIYKDCDPKLMYRALYNLLYNCVEHNPENTRIMVTLAESPQAIIISIEDDGLGFDEKELAFYDESRRTSEKPERPKGLGLYIARAILAAHEADLRLENLPEAGSRLSVIWKSRDKARE